MKKDSIIKIIALMCELAGLYITFPWLSMGINSIYATGLSQIGTAFILPSLLVIILIVIDFLITIDVIKKGLSYSLTSSIFKILIFIIVIGFFIINKEFNIDLIILLVLTIISSILNSIKCKDEED